MVDVWAVIGNTNAGKSSAIRALTGVSGKHPSWLVAYSPNGTGFPTYVHPQGLQEKPISPAAFIAEVKRAKVTRVIVALRLKAARKQPDAQSYINKFSAVGWNIAGLAALNPNHPLLGFPTHVATVPGRPSLASNEIARHLRKLWGFA